MLRNESQRFYLVNFLVNVLCTRAIFGYNIDLVVAVFLLSAEIYRVDCTCSPRACPRSRQQWHTYMNVYARIYLTAMFHCMHEPAAIATISF